MLKKTSKIKTLETLEPGECKWPIGDPRQEGFHFCGAQQVLGRPYCIEHWQLSFVTRNKGDQHAQHPARPALPPVRRAA